MNTDRVKEILRKINKVKVAVYGDFCLDAYWMLDPRGSEISVETGLRAMAVGKQRYSLGGAGNIVANLMALEPADVQVIGVVGDDVFGREMNRQLAALGADTSRMVVQKDGFDTVTYSKRYLEGNEEPRIDFGIHNRRTAETDKALLESIHDCLKHVDVMIINQQIPVSINNAAFIKGLNKLLNRFTDKIILLDTRHYGDKFANVYRKMNATEAARLNGANAVPGDVVRLQDVKRYAKLLYKKAGKPVFITRGDRGLIVHDKNGASEVPGILTLKQTDPVGSGDTLLSALACCLAAGILPHEAAEFANFAAAVTVQKLFQTGTATGAEILHVATDTDYVYQPELAEDMRQAVYLGTTEIELCCDFKSISTGAVKHAVFDHDGTISALRQGWEDVMEPMMIRAILGSKYDTADETLYHKVRNRVRDYIDKSTGIETILQMEALVEMVNEFGIVPQKQRKDKYGYKKVYNDALMERVGRRTNKLGAKELDVADFTIKGAVQFLAALRKRGVKLYLASGTDRGDVIREAKKLGYADLFDGGMYGYTGDLKAFSKKLIIEKILKENNLRGAELIVVGDGPVEIRECRKHGGLAIGIASDEIRRHGLNMEKRSRLIKAGSHLIIPDFSQYQKLLQLLFRTHHRSQCT